MPLEQTQSLSGAPTGSDGQEIEIGDTTATATATEGLDAQTILLDGLKIVHNLLARINATMSQALQEITTSFTKIGEGLN